METIAHSPNITDWILAISSTVTAIGILFVLVQTFLLYRQNRDARMWNKLHSAMTFLPSQNQLNDLEIELNDAPVRLIDRADPLTREDMDELLMPASGATRIKLKNYLNLMERYCTAINHGLVDGDLAKAMFSEKFRRHFEEMSPFIEHYRRLHNAPDYFFQLERVLESWKPKIQDASPRY